MRDAISVNLVPIAVARVTKKGEMASTKSIIHKAFSMKVDPRWSRKSFFISLTPLLPDVGDYYRGNGILDGF